MRRYPRVSATSSRLSSSVSAEHCSITEHGCTEGRPGLPGRPSRSSIAASIRLRANRALPSRSISVRVRPSALSSGSVGRYSATRRTSRAAESVSSARYVSVAIVSAIVTRSAGRYDGNRICRANRLFRPSFRSRKVFIASSYPATITTTRSRLFSIVASRAAEGRRSGGGVVVAEPVGGDTVPTGVGEPHLDKFGGGAGLPPSGGSGRCSGRR